MKVLERKDESLKSFQYEHTCEVCESRLLVEHGDLLYTPGGCDQRDNDSWPESFAANCAVCTSRFVVPAAKIPKYVKFVVRTQHDSRPASRY